MSLGGALGPLLEARITGTSTTSVKILTGYVGIETVINYRAKVPTLGQVKFELVVGMAAKEGLTNKTYNELISLNEDLIKHASATTKRNGVYVYFNGGNGNFKRDQGIHAKVYSFELGGQAEMIIGSSNFSPSGLNAKGNIEMNLVEDDTNLCYEFQRFYDGLHSNGNLVRIDKVSNFPIKGSSKVAATEIDSRLSKVHVPNNFKSLPYFDIDLGINIDNQTASNLNVCFSKGRWSRATNLVRPRDWYEVEIICPAQVISNPIYPKGDFVVITSDGVSFEGTTNGENFKNLRSKGDLKLLGRWLKGRLEAAGCLSDNPQELVTESTFLEYGNSTLRIYMQSKQNYIFHFPRENKDL